MFLLQRSTMYLLQRIAIYVLYTKKYYAFTCFKGLLYMYLLQKSNNLVTKFY